MSNHRIEALEDGKVAFGYKDYKAGSMKKSMTLEANEFIRDSFSTFYLVAFTKSGILASLHCAT